MLFPPTNWTFGCLMLLLLNVFLQGVRNCLDFYPNSPTMSNPFIPYRGFTVMVFPCFSRFIFPRSSRLWPNHHHWGFPNPDHPRGLKSPAAGWPWNPKSTPPGGPGRRCPARGPPPPRRGPPTHGENHKKD